MSREIHRYSDLTDDEKQRVVVPLYWKRIEKDGSVSTLPIYIDGMTEQEIADAQVRWCMRGFKQTPPSP